MKTILIINIRDYNKGAVRTTSCVTSTNDDYDYSGGVDPIDTSLVGDEDYVDHQYLRLPPRFQWRLLLVLLARTTTVTTLAGWTPSHPSYSGMKIILTVNISDFIKGAVGTTT